MTLTKIFSGMELGPEAIDANFKDNLLEISAWTDAGMTYINGYSQHTIDMPNTLKYRTIKLGGVLIETQFGGFFDAPALKSTQGVVEVCKFPTEIFRSGLTLIFNKNCYISTGQYVMFGTNSDDSALTINLWGLTKEFTTRAMVQTNLCLSW
ncbi:hypothetical protein [Loigolactobacillus jiayinensis]|uniref:Uncharacterized protein n=1 Tax=Loigolactobacillus jiayinensis TaxID=2486016 RepID=A0ABW1RC39_9LACO|nr:hypothetical protein [Loigolactobacillus jiayinensis]